MAYKNIQLLIEYYAEFEKETGLDGMKHFSNWFSKKMNPVEMEKQTVGEMVNNTDQKILQGFAMLANHSKHYVKTATKDTPLSGWNDLLMLIVLSVAGPTRKTELIKYLIIDLSPGMEVIKRMLRHQLLEEEEDPTDGRAKLVKASKKGMTLVKEMKYKIHSIGKIIGGNLSNADKEELLPLLYKLAKFHKPIFEDDYGMELELIVEKYFSGEE